MCYRILDLGSQEQILIPPSSGFQIACFLTYFRSLHKCHFSGRTSLTSLFEIISPLLPAIPLVCFTLLHGTYHLTYYNFYLCICHLCICLFFLEHNLCQGRDFSFPFFFPMLYLDYLDQYLTHIRWSIMCGQIKELILED